MTNRDRSDSLASATAIRRQFGQARRLAAFVLVVIGLTFIGRSTVAEFEIPLVDTANAPTQPEFRAVWAFNRGLGPVVIPGAVAHNGYEAYAVGVDKGSTDVDKNGIFYFYNGASWSRVASPMAGASDVYSLNAVVGQENNGEGNDSPLWVAGSKARISEIPQYYRLPGADDDYGRFWPETIDGLSGPDATKDFYALDAAQTYGGAVLAGGQQGLVAWAGGKGGDTPGNQRHWTRISPSILNATENITGIRFSNYSTAYVVTSTFTGDAMDRTCPGSQIGRLYKVSMSDPANWQRLSTSVGECFFGVAVGTRDVATGGGHGPLGNVIWIATSNGILKYDESTGIPSTMTGTIGKLYTSVAAVPDRGGLDQNLLYNGDFESLVSTTYTPTTQVDSWLYEVSHYTGTPGNCQLNEIQTTTPGKTGLYAVTVEPKDPSYTDAGCTDSFSGPAYTTGVLQRVELSTIEGQRFRVSGWYKVEFPSGVGTLASAQGGVATVCTGNVNNLSPEYINCSLSNRSLIKTFDAAAGPNFGGTGGWQQFSLTLSRQDGVFKSIGQSNAGFLTPRKMVLEIRCEATRGAKVTCDNLKVEEVSSPTITQRDTFVVLGAPGIGATDPIGGVDVNDDALSATSSFVNEAIPTKVFTDAVGGVSDRLYSLSAVGKQHVFGAGAGVTGSSTSGLVLLNRTPSTLAGTIWAGLSSPISATGSASLGSISVSCVNNRDAAGTTLCQRSPESYGISLERHPISPILPTDTTLVGSLTGRAWFGKTADLGFEALNLDRCLRAPTDPNPDVDPRPEPATKPYYLGGLCDRTMEFPWKCWKDPTKTSHTDDFCVVDSSCSDKGTGLCDVATRRCWKDKAHTERTAVSCLSDFDCYGRCERDEGFLCVTDEDCRYPSTSTSNPVSWGSFAIPPPSRLVCNPTSPVSTAVPASPLACSSVGWLSFNKSDFSAAQQTAPDNSSIGVNYNTLFPDHNQGYPDLNQGGHELSGWGRFMTPANSSNPNSQNTGWVRLRGDAAAAANSRNPNLFACRDCIGSLGQMNCAFCQDESNQSCKPSDNPGEANCSYLCEGSATPTPCVTNDQCNGIGSGQCKAPGYCTGNGTTQCASDAECTDVGGHCAVGALCLPIGSQCAKYGVNLDTETGKFYGYAWSQDFGWLSFQNVTQGGGRIIQTRLADIYAQGPIGAAGIPTPIDPNNCNGTYLITSSLSITNFCSAYPTDAGGSITGTNIKTLQQNTAVIPFPGAGNIYQNILGRFDLKGIETDVGGDKNKYGASIVSANSASGTGLTDLSYTGGGTTDTFGARVQANANVLGGKVYVASGQANYTLDEGLALANSSDLSTQGSGAGVLIVNGDLTINASPIALSYQTGNITDLRRLASLVVVVKGNLTIANTVQNLVGAYYVTGTVTTVTDAQLNNQYPLTVRGLMIASRFKFQRQYAGTIETPLPSELFVYDGRLQSNPLPGMTDFVNALPSTVNPGP